MHGSADGNWWFLKDHSVSARPSSLLSTASEREKVMSPRHFFHNCLAK